MTKERREQIANLKIESLITSNKFKALLYRMKVDELNAELIGLVEKDPEDPTDLANSGPTEDPKI